MTLTDGRDRGHRRPGKDAGRLRLRARRGRRAGRASGPGAATSSTCSPATPTRPFRVDFFGDDIEAIRPFDPETQRSSGRQDALTLRPVREVPYEKEAVARATARLLDELPGRAKALRAGESWTSAARSTPSGWKSASRATSPSSGRRPTSTTWSITCRTSTRTPSARWTMLPAGRPPGPGRAEPGQGPLGAGRGRDRGDRRDPRRARRMDLRRYPPCLPLRRPRCRCALCRRTSLPSSSPCSGREPEGIKPRRTITTQSGGDGELCRAVCRRSLRPWTAGSGPASASSWSASSRRRCARFWPTTGCRPRRWSGWTPGGEGGVYRPARRADRRVQAARGGSDARHRHGHLRPPRPPEGPAAALFKEGLKITSYLELREGDYVVHIHHGIGRYAGITHLKGSDGAERDYLLLEYAEGDKVYVPTDQVDRVQKYIGNQDAPPTITRLNSGDWARATQAGQKAGAGDGRPS